MGVWGLKVCLLDVAFCSQPSATDRNRSQPLATVRSRPCDPHMAVSPYGKFCRSGRFWRFQTSRCFVSRGRRGSSWHSDVFCNVSFCVAGAIYFCDVFRRCVAVFVAGAALWTCPSSFFVAGAALSTCRVACFLRIALAGLRQVATRCKFRGRRGFFWDVMKIDASLARNIDFEVANLEVLRKLLGKRPFWSYKVWKFQDVSHEMLVFLHPLVSSRVSSFPVASPCLWGKLQNLSFSKVSKQVVMLFCVAGVALCDIPTCLITCRKCQNWRMSRTKCSFFCTHLSRLEFCGFPVASPCLWGKLQNLSFSKVSKQVVMLFCMAGVALCDIPTCLITCRKCQKRRMSRTKCSFFCTHLSCVESLVFLWRRRV